MERVLKIVFAITFSINLCRTQELKYPYCTVTKGTNQASNLPKLQDTFQTQIEANFVLGGYSMDINEYFDDKGNQGALRMVLDGIEQYAIYSYETNEFISGSIGSDDCVVANLSNSATNTIFGETTANGEHHIFTTSGALRFGSQFGETYLGGDQVRGIYVDHWQSCVYWKVYDAYFTVDYYFTMKNWTSGIALPQTPVRAWVKGVGKDDKGNLVPFNHYYDFFAYRPGVVDMANFETPKGVVCANRVKTKAIPKLSGQYYYREEIIQPGLSIVQQADVWYDSTYNLLRYDYRNPSYGPPYYDTNPLTEIHDYNNAIAYVIDNIMGNCTIAPVENSTFDVSLNYSATMTNGQFFDQMKTSLGLFYLDDTYTYEGQRTVSGINTDVFISRRTDFKPSGINGAINSTFEYYFLASDWTQIANPGVTKDTTVPVRLEVTSQDISYHVIYNFYDFDEEHPNLDNFDISPCYDDAETIDFQIAFKAKYFPVVDTYKKFFELSNRLKIAAVSEISPIRIQRSSIKYSSYFVYYLATLLEAPPAASQFHRYPKQVLENRNDLQIPNEGDPENCANYCLQENTFLCLSFDVCPSKNLCYLSKSTADDGQLVDNDACSHYTKSVKKSTFAEIQSSEAFATIKDAVYRNLFSFDIPIGAEDKQTFRAAYVRQNIIRPDTMDTTASLTGADYMKQFVATRNKQIQANNDNKLTQVSVDDCATACVDEDLFVCEAFEYNVLTGDCFLSKLHPSEHSEFVHDAPNIDLYARNYLYKFTKSPGVVMLAQSNLVYQSISDPNVCAKLCANLQEYSCKSFEFCEDIQGCILGRNHKLDIPETQIKSSPSCDHYSRNYIDDFKFLKGKVIALVNNQIIESVSLASCAKICADQGNNCMGFDYCGNDTMCRITSDSVKNIGDVTVETSSYCNHYARQYYSDGSKVTTFSVRNTPDPSKKYTAGAMAGIAIGMLIIGILLALGIVFGLQKYRGQANWNPATKLENM